MPGGHIPCQRTELADTELADAEGNGVVQDAQQDFWYACFASLSDGVRQKICDLGSELGVRGGAAPSITAGDLFREMLGSGEQLMASLENLPIVEKLQDQPLLAGLPLLAITIIVGTVGISFSCFCMPAMHMAKFSFPSMIFHSSFGMAVIAYHQGIITKPGRVPRSWRGLRNGKPKFAQDGTVPFEPLERKKKTNGYRYCKYEKKFKPDRAHFCRVAGYNVLRMDHFCPWIGNCVGFRNHKFFFLFVLYDTIATNLADACMMHALAVGGHTAMTTFMLYQGVFISTVASLVITPFACLHLWLLKNNMTTIEFCEGAFKTRAEELGLPVQSPYDLGLWHNVSSVFGTEWHTWPLPWVKPVLGDGIHWEVAPMFRHLKYLPRPMVSMATTARDDEEPKQCQHEDDEEDADDLVASPPSDLNIAGQSRRRCAAARNGVGGGACVQRPLADAAADATDGLLSLASKLVEKVSPSSGSSPLSFLPGGIRGLQECTEDFSAFSVQKAQEIYALLRPPAPPPQPRMKSTVSRRREAAGQVSRSQ